MTAAPTSGAEDPRRAVRKDHTKGLPDPYNYWKGRRQGDGRVATRGWPAEPPWPLYSNEPMGVKFVGALPFLVSVLLCSAARQDVASLVRYQLDPVPHESRRVVRVTEGPRLDALPLSFLDDVGRKGRGPRVAGMRRRRAAFYAGCMMCRYQKPPSSAIIRGRDARDSLAKPRHLLGVDLIMPLRRPARYLLEVADLGAHDLVDVLGDGRPEGASDDRQARVRVVPVSPMEEDQAAGEAGLGRETPRLLDPNVLV